MTTVANTNRSLVDKKVHHFDVSFYRMDENLSNILGRQVLDLNRPTITANMTSLYQKGRQLYDPTTIIISPIDVTLADDENSLTTKAVYTFLKKQVRSGSVATASFDMNVKLYSFTDKIVEEFTLLQCFIESISHTQQTFGDTDDTNKIIVTIHPMDVDYTFHD